MKYLARFRQILVCLTLLFALSTHVLAQPAPVPEALAEQGDIIFLEGQDLETSLENALTGVVEEATGQLAVGEDVQGVFTSKAFLTILFGLLSSVVTYFMTNGIKLSTEAIKGRKTQIVAGLISVVTAGVGGYFGLSEVAGVSGLEGALLAGLSVLGSFGIAVGAHETRRQQQTGQRKPDRKAGAMVSDTVLESLVIAGKLLPPPFNLAEPVIRNLYTAHGAAFVSDLINQQQAMSEAEIKTDQDKWEEANAVPKVVRKPDPFKTDLPTPNPQGGSR